MMLIGINGLSIVIRMVKLFSMLILSRWKDLSANHIQGPDVTVVELLAILYLQLYNMYNTSMWPLSIHLLSKHGFKISNRIKIRYECFLE